MQVSLDKYDRGRLRALVYLVQFEPNPTDGIERVVSQLIASRGVDEVNENFTRAIRLGLESNERLSDLISQRHSESVIRDYLKAVQDKILLGREPLFDRNETSTL